MNTDDAFSTMDLAILRNPNQFLGLRVTNNPNELAGGEGDVIPLYELAGAIDIIEFVTLSCFILNKCSRTQINEMRKRLMTIFSKYINQSLVNVPDIILTYAKILDLDVARNIECTCERLSSCEEYQLSRALLFDDKLLTPEQLFTNDLNDYPQFTEALTKHFNQFLYYRLKQLEQDDLLLRYFFLIKIDKNTIEDVSHVNEFPLGKIKSIRFKQEQIVAVLTANIGIDATLLLRWLKNSVKQLKITPPFSSSILDSHEIEHVPQMEPSLITELRPPLEPPKSIFNQCIDFCIEKKVPIALTLGFGFFAFNELSRRMQDPNTSSIPCEY